MPTKFKSCKPHIFNSQTTLLNYKFRLYPTSKQEARLVGTLGACRWVYNYFIKLAGHGFLTKEDMNYALTELKEQEPWLNNNYHSKMLQMVSTQLEGAEKALKVLRRNGYRIGKLHFIKRDEYNSFTYNQSGFKLEKHGNTDLLWLSKIGYIEIRLHRPINGIIKQVTVTRKAGRRRWYVCISVKKGFQMPQPIDFKKAVGIDVGIKNYAYDSDSNVTPNPENLKKMLKPLVRANRRISRRVKGSQNYRKAVKHYQIIHERIANRRKDFLHKLSTHYASRYDVVFLERLRVANMTQNHNLAQSITDASWGMFKQMIDYKSKLMIEVEPRNTTVDCSRCGNKVSKSLAVRIHRCDKCGLIIDRDYNASLNILKRGLQLLEIPRVPREVTPVEILMGSMKQEEAIGLVR